MKQAVLPHMSQKLREIVDLSSHMWTEQKLVSTEAIEVRNQPNKGAKVSKNGSN